MKKDRKKKKDGGEHTGRQRRNIDTAKDREAQERNKCIISKTT